MTTDRSELGVAEEAGWGELLQLASSLTPEQLEEPGYSAEGWSVKDLMAHIAAWLAEATQVFEQIQHGTHRTEDRDVDALNRRFYEANKDLPAPMVRAECAASRNRMLVEWTALPEVTLEAREWFRESGPEHYAEHLPRLREWVRSLRSR
jgi:hypothetical protein